MIQNLKRRRLLAGLAGGVLGIRGARAQSSGAPLRAAFVYVTPIGATGWTAQHEAGRLQMQAALGSAVRSRAIADVAEGADAERVVRELAHDGEQLIFTTSFGYMDAVLRVAQEFPATRFEQCSGYKLAANVAAYNGRFYEGRYLAGMLAGGMGQTAGMVAPFPIPEVIQGINAFTLGMRAVNPRARTKVVWVNSWYDPGREADAARALLAQGADVLTHHTNSPAALQVAEQRGRFALGYCSDEARFAPHAQLGAVVLNWGDYYTRRVRAVLDGHWQSQNLWGGMDLGFVELAALRAGLPPELRRRVQERRAAIVGGAFKPFSGRILDNRGAVLCDGAPLPDAVLQRMDRYVDGVDGDVPRAG